MVQQRQIDLKAISMIAIISASSGGATSWLIPKAAGGNCDCLTIHEKINGLSQRMDRQEWRLEAIRRGADGPSR